jgi:hypothetical protein
MEFVATVILNIIWMLFWFWIGMQIVRKLKEKYDPRLLNTSILSSEEILSQQLKKILTMKTEVHDGVIFAFTVGDDTFIAQGATIEEVADNLYKYRKIDLAFINHEGKEYWVINGKLSKVNLKLV